MEAKKSYLKRKNTDEKVHFEKKDEEIYTEEDSIKDNPCKVIREVTDSDCFILNWQL